MHLQSWMDAISLFQLSKYLCQGEGLASLMRLDSLEPDSPAGSLNVRGSSEILGISPFLANGLNRVIIVSSSKAIVKLTKLNQSYYYIIKAINKMYSKINELTA